KEKTQQILSMDFLHHNLDYLIEDVHNKFVTKRVPKKVIETLEDLEFIVPEKNKEASINSDIEKLLTWACKHNISEKILPHTKEQLLSLEVLNLSDIPLHTIPKHIRVLKNLKKLYLVNCQLTKLPLEIFTLDNLEILWVQNNHLTTLSKEINNLKRLRELVVYENNIQFLPSMKNLKQLSFIALHSNLLSAKKINKFLKTIPQNVKATLYDQRQEPPFVLEPLSYMTLKEAERLRDDIFDDIEDIEKDLLLASLNITRYKKILEKNDVTTLSYWVARDRVSRKVIGLTGVYTEIDDEKNCWLGWFCVDETYRGQGFGKKLLEFSIEQAQKMEKRHLHLYTYNAKKFEKAINIYNKYGFQEYQEESNDELELYLKKLLNKKAQ
ncbi:MAG: GNAT family N-acetyltransferase, partial [Sulfurimonas sp.]